MNKQQITPAFRISEIKEYYFSKKLTEVRNLKISGKPIVNLGIGNPDIQPHSTVLDSLISSSKEPESHFYQSYKGMNELREAYSSWYNKIYNVDLNPATEILPLTGSKEGIMLVTFAFVNPGDKILIPDPGYPAYTSMAHMAGAEIIYYKLKEENNWMPDFDNLEQLAKENNIKLMWVNYPHMPTGTQANENLFMKIAEFSAKNQIIVCNDNPYSLILSNKPLSLLSYSGNNSLLIELNSLSKSHNLQGLRLGVALSDESVINYLLRVKSNYDSGMYKPLQEAAITAMSLKEEWYDKQNAIYKNRKEKVFQMLDILKCKYKTDTAGLFVWAKIPEIYKNGEELSDKLLYEHDIFITPGKVFGKQGKKYIRISLSASDEEINEALKRITENFKA